MTARYALAVDWGRIGAPFVVTFGSGREMVRWLRALEGDRHVRVLAVWRIDLD